MHRMVLVKLHVLLAAFFLPVAIMFMVTGALYTWDKKGEYNNEEFALSLQAPLPDDKDALTELAKTELVKNGISFPEGTPSLKTYGPHFQLVWTGSSKDVVLEPTADAAVAKLTVKHTTWYRKLVQLHKAKGGNAFKVYAAAFAIAILLLLLSGFILALQMPKLRRFSIASAAGGLMVFALLVWLG